MPHGRQKNKERDGTRFAGCAQFRWLFEKLAGIDGGGETFVSDGFVRVLFNFFRVGLRFILVLLSVYLTFVSSWLGLDSDLFRDSTRAYNYLYMRILKHLCMHVCPHTHTCPE